MAQFSLPVLNTQYETVQKIPTSNWMTALGQGADMVSKAAGQYKDYKDFQEEERKKKEAEQKRKDLEAMLLKGKTDKSELDELRRMQEELMWELKLAYDPNSVKAEPLQSNMVPSQTAISETQTPAAPINIPEFGFKLPSLETTPAPQTGFMLPQLRGF